MKKTIVLIIILLFTITGCGLLSPNLIIQDAKLDFNPELVNIHKISGDFHVRDRIAWSPDGQKIAGGTNQDNLLIYNIPNKQIQIINDFISESREILWFPDSESIVYIHTVDHVYPELRLINTKTQNSKVLLKNPGDKLIPQLTPRGHIWAYDKNDKYYLFDSRGNRVDINYNADVFRMESDSNLTVLNVDGKRGRHILSNFYINYLHFNNCNSIVYSNFNIIAYNIQRNYFTQIAENGILPRWSPDGKFILFNSFKGILSFLSTDIYVVNKSGNKMMQLTFSDNDGELCPVWSPDQKYIAFWTVNDLALFIAEIRGLY